MEFINLFGLIKYNLNACLNGLRYQAEIFMITKLEDFDSTSEIKSHDWSNMHVQEITGNWPKGFHFHFSIVCYAMLNGLN